MFFEETMFGKIESFNSVFAFVTDGIFGRPLQAKANCFGKIICSGWAVPMFIILSKMR